MRRCTWVGMCEPTRMQKQPSLLHEMDGKKMYQVIVLRHVKLLVFASRCRLEVLRNQQQQEEER